MKTLALLPSMQPFYIENGKKTVNSCIPSVNEILNVDKVCYLLPITLYFLPLTGFTEKIALFLVLINLFSYFCKKFKTIFFWF